VLASPYGLTVGSDIYVKVSAENTLAFSSESDPTDTGLDVQYGNPPAAPTVEKQENEPTLNISWNAEACAIRYALYVNGE
jgi:hypothetical protein